LLLKTTVFDIFPMDSTVSPQYLFSLKGNGFAASAHEPHARYPALTAATPGWGPDHLLSRPKRRVKPFCAQRE